MSADDKMDADGIRNDGVRVDPAASHMRIYPDDRQQLAPFREPGYVPTDRPHSRWCCAVSAGAGNANAVRCEELAAGVQSGE